MRCDSEGRLQRPPQGVPGAVAGLCDPGDDVRLASGVLTSVVVLSSTIHRTYYHSYKKIYLEEKKQGKLLQRRKACQ